MSTGTGDGKSMKFSVDPERQMTATELAGRDPFSGFANESFARALTAPAHNPEQAAPLARDTVYMQLSLAQELYAEVGRLNVALADARRRIPPFRYVDVADYDRVRDNAVRLNAQLIDLSHQLTKLQDQVAAMKPKRARRRK